MNFLNYKNGKLYTKSVVLVFWLLIVSVLLTKSNSSGSSVCIYCDWWGLDKAVHFFLFFVLESLLVLWLREIISMSAMIFLTSSAFSVFYLVFLEFSQIGLIGRSFSWWDIVFGLLGVLFGLFLFFGNIFKRGRPKLLLHSCCAVCACYIAELLKKDYDVTLYFFNPNISDRDEYRKRLMEAKKVARKLDLRIIYEKYEHQKWLSEVRGLEGEPEKGSRCYSCYRYRLKKTARKARSSGFALFSTTLSVSPYKVYSAISSSGNEAARISGVTFVDVDFKKNDGFKKTMNRAKKWGIYRQNYCGCEFSLRK